MAAWYVLWARSRHGRFCRERVNKVVESFLQRFGVGSPGNNLREHSIPRCFSASSNFHRRSRSAFRATFAEIETLHRTIGPCHAIPEIA